MGTVKWYEKRYRRNLVDMHIEDWDERFLSQFDPVEYVAMMKNANVQAVMIYANSHVGHCNWATESGHMHEGLQGRDILGETIELCRKEGMAAIPYYSLIYNNWAYEEYPEWRIRGRNGKTSRQAGGPAGWLGRRYGVVCPNNSDYRNFVETQIKEICDRYDFEGMFFDMNFWPDICFCDSCRSRYEREVGGEIPTIIDWNDEKWITFQKKREEWISDFGLFSSTAAKKYKPGITTEHNSAALLSSWVGGNTLSMLQANDYNGGDLYGGTLSQSFICKFFLSITPNMPFEYMVSRCFPNLRDHTTSKSEEMLEQQSLYALAHNGSFLFIDAINPDGSLQPRIYETVGAIFEKASRYEDFFGGNLCADAAVYYSLHAKMDPDLNGIEVGSSLNAVMKAPSPHFNAALGAVRALKEAHIPFGVISKNNLDSLSSYQIIVVPDLPFMDEEEVRALKEYAERGGVLYVSGKSGRFFQDRLDIVIDGRMEEAVSYMTPEKEFKDLMPGVTESAPLAIFGKQVKAEKKDPKGVMATITLPYTDPSDIPNDSIPQMGPSADLELPRFASIHSNPPGRSTDHPAIVLQNCGRGKLLWTAAPIELPDKHLHKKVFARLVQKQMQNPACFRAEAPPAIEIIVFHQPERKRYLINAVNTQELLPPVTAQGVRVLLNVEGKKVTAVKELPEQKPLSYSVDNDGVVVEMPPVYIFASVIVQYEQ